MAKVDKEDWKSTPDSDEQSNRERGEPTIPEFDHEPLAIRLMFNKLNEAIDLSNTQVDSIAVNTAKTGITTAQASAIAANTAKTGITNTQADAISANTKKTGITTAQATLLSNLNAGRASGLMTNINKVTAQITELVSVNAKTGAATLNSTIVLSNGDRYTLSQALTKVNKK